MMEIKKRLMLPESNEITAVMLNDEGEEYPVFLETLHNTLVFPTLMESGYSLDSLPYGFVKNGVGFEDLPVEKYNCTDAELEMMYNSIGSKLPYDEIKSHVNVNAVKGIKLPPTNYTITTREELLQYLDATSSAQDEQDFLPLNYFVAPSARFSLREYKSKELHKYVDLITNRRTMSLKKFRNLLAFLKKMGVVGASPSVQDVLNGYFAWGMDGLDFIIINKRTEQRAFRLMPSLNVKSAMERRTFGFIDGLGNLLTPLNERDVVWKIPGSSNPETIPNLIRGMKPNETKVVNYLAPAKTDVTILEGIEYNIQFSDNTVVMQMQTYTPLRVVSPIAIGKTIPLSLALPVNEDKLMTMCTLEAFADMIFEYRRMNIKVSSFDALTVSGCNARTALDYVVTKLDLSKDKSAASMQTENAMPQIQIPDIESFLEGETDQDETIKSFLEDIVQGVFNIDSIDKGKRIESNVSTETLFGELYAIHHVMGIPLQDMYEKIKTIRNGAESLTFTDGEITHTINTSLMKHAYNGYTRDVQSYDLKNAHDCKFFSFVTLVAREVGCDTADRHVGMEFYFVNRMKKPVEALLNQLAEMYEERVMSTIPDAIKQTAAMRYVDVFTLSRYFEIAFKGTITYPNMVGALTVAASSDMITTANRFLELRIENLTAYCGFTVDASSSASLTFNAYCTNAYITPTYVIPRGSGTIHEVPFYAAWCDWRTKNPQIWEALVNAGTIKADFIPWENRYYDQQFVCRNLEELDRVDSLMHYYDVAIAEVADYPDDKEFTAVTHPTEYMFPGLKDENDEDYVALPKQRDGAPTVRIGLCRDITIDNYKTKLYPSEEIKDADTYIKPFRGFSADALMLVEDVMDKLPKSDKQPITVMATHDSIFVSDLNQVMHFSRIVELDSNRYPIVHVYDRIYLLRATDGRIWEVRI